MFIQELGHLLVARLFRVPTSELELGVRRATVHLQSTSHLPRTSAWFSFTPGFAPFSLTAGFSPALILTGL
jgi:hypothetical protein